MVVIFFVILCLGIFGFVAFQSFSLSKYKIRQAKIHYEKEMSASEISFVEYKDSQKRLSFKTKKIEVSRKKIGFLRLGFYKVVELEGLKAEVYLYDDEKTNIEDVIDLNNSLLNNKSVQTLNLDNVFELKITDFWAKFYKEGDLISSLKSDNADFIFYQKDLVFSGNVILRSGNNKILKCESLRYLRDRKLFQTKDDFRLISGREVIVGKGLVTDYLLENIEYVCIIKKIDIDQRNHRLDIVGAK